MKAHSESELEQEEQNGVEVDGACGCGKDPYAALPPDLRPRMQTMKGGLREVICPGCGIKYRTNRSTDFCIKCE
jgi:hypothetical protein